MLAPDHQRSKQEFLFTKHECKKLSPSVSDVTMPKEFKAWWDCGGVAPGVEVQFEGTVASREFVSLIRRLCQSHIVFGPVYKSL